MTCDLFPPDQQKSFKNFVSFSIFYQFPLLSRLKGKRIDNKNRFHFLQNYFSTPRELRLTKKIIIQYRKTSFLLIDEIEDFWKTNIFF